MSGDKLFSRWTHFLGLGLGSGLSPVAPGTFGSVAALVLYFPISLLPTLTYVGLVIAALALGVHICQEVADDLGVEDPGAVVWDEFVGLWIALTFVPSGWYWLLGGFVLFRAFDILKPWPVSYFDRMGGGLGIMLDDVAAGIYTLIVLQLLFVFMS